MQDGAIHDMDDLERALQLRAESSIYEKWFRLP
jgi:hypothetical protein